MNELQKLINSLPTDSSGKWMAIGDVNELAKLIVNECAVIASINQHQWESAGAYVLKHFGVTNE